jgi:hypothetical protein
MPHEFVFARERAVRQRSRAGIAARVARWCLLMSALVCCNVIAAPVSAPLDVPNLPVLAPGTVNAIASAPDGSFFIGGSFTTVDTNERSHIAKIRSDGALPSWQATLDGDVYALAVDSDGFYVYAGGAFTSASGETRFGIVKLDAETGAVDPMWAAQLAGTVYSLAIGPDGSVFAGGDFSAVGGIARSNLVKLDAVTGDVDATWNARPNAAVRVLATDASWLYVGGDFTSIGGAVRNHLARVALDGSGAPDPAWQLAANDTVYALAVAPDFVYAGGEFTSIAGMSQKGIARVSAASAAPDLLWKPFMLGESVRALALDSSGLYVGGRFDVMGFVNRAGLARLSITGNGNADPDWHPAPDDDVFALAVRTDGGIVEAGGRFGTIDGAQHFSLASLRADDGGAADADDCDAEIPGEVKTIAVQPSGNMVVGGRFGKVGQTERRNVFRLLSDGTLDTLWNPAVDDAVNAVLADSGSTVYLAGGFDHVGGFSRSGLAKVSGVNGAVDANWNPSPFGEATALARALDGSVFAAAMFVDSNNAVTHMGIARLPAGGNGAPDPLWNPMLNNVVRSIAVAANGSVYVGGDFSMAGSLARHRIAKLDGSGSGAPDPLWNPPSANDLTLAVAIGSDGDLFASGGATVGGIGTATFEKFDGSGTGAADPAWHPAVAQYRALVSDGAGHLYGGGSNPRGLVRVFEATGANDAAWQPSVHGFVGALAIDFNGAIFAGGNFDSASGVPRSSLAAWPPSAIDEVAVTITSIGPEPSLPAQTWTVSAHVDVAMPSMPPASGTITFSRDGDTCEAELESSGDASCTFDGGTGGTFDVVAHYNGDSAYNEADSAPVAHSIARAATTIELSPGGSSVATEPVHFFANLGSSVDVDGGTVTIGDGESSCTADVVFFTAECDVVFAHAGVHQVTAAYSGDDAHEPAVSEPETQTVTAASTGLEIVSHTPDPSIPGQPVTVTVELSLFGGAIGPATGAISIGIVAGGPPCTIVLPDTSCDIVLTQRGAQTLVATYLGNDDFVSSNASAGQIVNELPIANADEASTNEDQPFTVNASDGVLANDEDPDGDTLVVADPGARSAGGIGGDVVLFYDGSFEYTPPPNANGDATFEYTLSDGLEDASAPTSVTIHVRPVNDPPTFSLAANPHFGAGPAGVRETPGFATMTSSGPGESDHVLAWNVRTISDASGVLSGDATIALDGTLSTPLSGHGGTAMFAVSLTDDGGTDSGGSDTSVEQTFTVTVSAGADLSVSIFDGTDFVAGGGTAIYEITVRNLGGDNVTSARATIGASANLTELEWTCTAFDGATCSASGTGTVSDTLSLTAGSSAVYELTASVSANPELPAEVDATIAALTGATDFNPANDSAHDLDTTGIFEGGFDPPQTPPGR